MGLLLRDRREMLFPCQGGSLKYYDNKVLKYQDIKILNISILWMVGLLLREMLFPCQGGICSIAARNG